MSKPSGKNLPTVIDLAPIDWRSDIKAPRDQVPVQPTRSELAQPTKKGRGYVKFRSDTPHTQPRSQARLDLRPFDELMRLLRGAALFAATVIIGAQLWPAQDIPGKEGAPSLLDAPITDVAVCGLRNQTAAED
jgi:hypothetical protein